jgi:hypothetical protein
MINSAGIKSFCGFSKKIFGERVGDATVAERSSGAETVFGRR